MFFSNFLLGASSYIKLLLPKVRVKADFAPPSQYAPTTWLFGAIMVNDYAQLTKMYYERSRMILHTWAEGKVSRIFQKIFKSI